MCNNTINRKINTESFYWLGKGPWPLAELLQVQLLSFRHTARSESSANPPSESVTHPCALYRDTEPKGCTASYSCETQGTHLAGILPRSCIQLELKWRQGRKEQPATESFWLLLNVQPTAHSRGTAASGGAVQNQNPGTARAANILEQEKFMSFFPVHFLCFQQDSSLTLHFTNQCMQEQAARAALPGNWIAGNHQVFPKITTQTAALRAAWEESCSGGWKGINCWENEEPSWYRDWGAIVFNLSPSLSNECFFPHRVAIVSDFCGSLAAGYQDTFIGPDDFMMCTELIWFCSIYGITPYILKQL